MEFYIAYKDALLEGVKFFILPFLVFLIALGFIYLVGRMWEITTEYKTKNKIASVVLVLAYILYFNTIEADMDIGYKIWYITLYMSISIIFYVLIGFKLYVRMESILDRLSGYQQEGDNNKKKDSNKKKKENKKKKI